MALGIFHFQIDMAWFPSVFFSGIVGLIAGVALPESGRQAARRIVHNLPWGWSKLQVPGLNLGGVQNTRTMKMLAGSLEY